MLHINVKSRRFGRATCLALFLASGSVLRAERRVGSLLFGQGTNNHAGCPRCELPQSPRPQFRQGEHLDKWLGLHQNLSTEELHRALQNEPGFKDLPLQQQQQLQNLLTRLRSMPPERRHRFIEGNEKLEHLPPECRQQVFKALRDLDHLPDSRRRLIAQIFRGARRRSLAERQVFLNEQSSRNLLSDQERSTLANLLAVEDFLPKG
jgi:hypothetical protein